MPLTLPLPHSAVIAGSKTTSNTKSQSSSLRIQTARILPEHIQSGLLDRRLQLFTDFVASEMGLDFYCGQLFLIACSVIALFISELFLG
jgi:hypothetical protein